MAKKFIIHNNLFIKGDVDYHHELIPENSEIKPEGGGRYHIDKENKKLYLYGVSTDFGGFTKEKLKEIVSYIFMGDELKGYNVYHSYIIKIDALNMKENDWTYVHTIQN